MGVSAAGVAQFSVQGYGTGYPASTMQFVVDGTVYSIPGSVTSMPDNTVLGNASGGTASPSALAMPSCTDVSGQHLNWTNDVGFSCGTTNSDRTRLTTTTAFFVRPSGSDTNCSGLVNANDPGSGTLPRPCAFSTIGGSVAILCQNYDLAGKTVTVTALTGNTYTGQISLCPFVGFSPSLGYGQVTIDVTGSTLAAGGSGIIVFASNNPTPWTFKGGTYTGCSVNCVYGDSGGVVALDGPNFGSVTGNHVTSLYLSRIIFVNRGYTISGGAGVHLYAQFQGAILMQPGFTVTTTTSTVTFTAGTDAVNWTAHGLTANSPVGFSTTGSLASPLVAGTVYYVKTVLDANSFTLSATPGGTLIDLTTSGSGTNTGTPAWSSFFAYSSMLGFINMTSVTYSGSATGTKFHADSNAVIQTNTGDGNKFPGTNNSCVPITNCTASGGQYF